MWDWVRIVGWSVGSALKSRRDHEAVNACSPYMVPHSARDGADPTTTEHSPAIVGQREITADLILGHPILTTERIGVVSADQLAVHHRRARDFALGAGVDQSLEVVIATRRTPVELHERSAAKPWSARSAAKAADRSVGAAGP